MPKNEKVAQKKAGWRDVRHRSHYAATKFAAKAAEQYKKIAKARSLEYRDQLLNKESKEFRDWCHSAPSKLMT